jgi:hypothetical protein
MQIVVGTQRQKDFLLVIANNEVDRARSLRCVSIGIVVLAISMGNAVAFPLTWAHRVQGRRLSILGLMRSP